MLIRLFFAVFLIFSPEGPDKAEMLRPPLDIPLIPSANFGEPRTGHFHSGVDFKTGGKTGAKVYSVADGHIYRIMVSPSGFGKALYIRHNNGYSSVYAHLSRFSPSIAEYVKKKQYEKESFSLNLFPPAEMFSIKRGEVIAYTGNSGSSMGPHLHFEVRNSANEKPLDPVQFYDIEDSTKPVIKSVAVYPAGSSSTVNGTDNKFITAATGSNGTYGIRYNKSIRVSGPVGFGINTYDVFDKSWNKCGVRIINLMIDDRLIYSHSIDEFLFSETRYINSHIDYEEKIKNNSYIQKTFLDPNNKLSIYNHVINNGIVNLDDGEKHNIEIGVSDFNGNYSSVKFSILADTASRNESTGRKGQMLPFSSKNEISRHDIDISFPAGCFYDTVYFKYRKAPPDDKGLLSDRHYIHEKYTPVHRNFELSIKPESGIKKGLKSKLCLVYLNEEHDTKYYAGGEYDKGWVKGSVRNLGAYAVGIDTIKPEIRPLGIHDTSSGKRNSKLRFRIKDDFSGISSYTGTINGEWALFEYDAKSSSLLYIPDEEFLSRNSVHDLILTVTDNCGNETVKRLEFYW